MMLKRPQRPSESQEGAIMDKVYCLYSTGWGRKEGVVEGMYSSVDSAKRNVPGAWEQSGGDDWRVRTENDPNWVGGRGDYILTAERVL